MTKRLVIVAGVVLVVTVVLVMLMARRAESKRQCSVPILMYHDVGDTANSPWCVPTETFRAQMASLRAQGFTTIMPADLSAHVTWGKPFPRKPIILTFDDGYLSALTIIEPILKENGFRAVIYLITGQVAETAADRREYEGKQCLVWTEVSAMQKRRTFAFGGHAHGHGNLAASGNPLPDIAECLKQLELHGIRRPHAFCYPFGQYKTNTARAVQEAGFQTAVVCEDAVASIGRATNLFALPRVSVMGGSHAFKLLDRTDVAGTTNVLYRIAHLGIPLEISVHLQGHRQDIWLPSRAITQGEFMLQFPRPAAGPGNARYLLEIWDKHRIFKLATINP